MQKYNLDYPEFFIKLYALFNPTLFHTRYLARFLRLSDLFLSSSYLPAALVASFAKRLSRLSLTAPPHGIAAIIPMVYNLLKQHPTCMQLIHRPDALPGRPDPFNPDEPDPLKTGALESSLWELAVHCPPFALRWRLIVVIDQSL
jgi:U3 small nucleolar RNA-associated protein 19